MSAMIGYRRNAAILMSRLPTQQATRFGTNATIEFNIFGVIGTQFNLRVVKGCINKIISEIMAESLFLNKII